MAPRPPHPDEVAARGEQVRRKYTIHVHHDRRRFVLRPWWATMTHGVFNVGEPGAGVWHARSREKLIAKCERWARRDAERQDVDAPEITVS